MREDKPAEEMTNLEIAQALSEAHTGDDFEGVCWEAARRMKAADARKKLDNAFLDASARTLRELAKADIMRQSVRDSLEATAEMLERMTCWTEEKG